MIFDYFNDISFGQPLFFILFAIIPVLIFWKFSKGKKQVAAINLSSTKGLANSRSLKNVFQQLPFVFRLLALSCIIIAMARPQTKFDEQQ
ncbi:MAG TPA: BatA domain-containing protein, partial [Hanamia sp.]|nr:BatA domain-containing protein [Hanamia sp.]